jgi:hypothetical protein
MKPCTWTPLETVGKIEATWGKYNPEMLGLVLEYFAGRSPLYCRTMYAVLADLHDGNWPPSRAVMIKMHEQVGSRMADYADRIPPARQLAAETEPVVEPEVGLARIREIINGLGKAKTVEGVKR